MEEEKQTQEPKEQAYSLVQVPTQYGLAIQTPAGTQVNEAELLVEIANKIETLTKAIAG